MVEKTQITATPRRLLSAGLTSRSIIEQPSALDDDALARLEAARDDDEIVLLEADHDRTRFKGPWRHLDEDAIGLVLQHHRARPQDEHVLLWGEEGGIGEHIRLQP